MTSFIDQMRKLESDDENYNNIWPSPDWTLKDYKKLFFLIECGYLIQHDDDVYFIKNPCPYGLDPWRSDEESDYE